MLLLSSGVVDEQQYLLSRVQTVDEQAELVLSRERANTRSRGLFVVPLTNEFDGSVVVSSKCELPHTSLYDSPAYRCTLGFVWNDRRSSYCSISAPGDNSLTIHLVE
jgi:hypothetical protein